MTETHAANPTRKPPAVGKSPQAKEDALRRVKFWKKSANAASVVGFITLSGVIVTQHAGATAKTAPATVAQILASSATATPTTLAQTATPVATADHLAATSISAQIVPATTTSPPAKPSATAATVKHIAKTPAKATKIASATAISTATTPPTATAAATSTPQATSAPAATSTPVPTSTTTQGGSNFGNTSTTQQPVAGSGAS